MSKYIKNLWGRIELICGNHDTEDVVMDIKEGPSSPFYACPKYYPENRTSDERACVNRINMIDFEKMLDHVQDNILEMEAQGTQGNLLHQKWKYKSIEFEIIGYDPHGKIKIKMINRKALR